MSTSTAGPVHLKRILDLRLLILFGLTFVGPTAPFPMFGIVSSMSHGHMALAYALAMVCMSLTAFSYGRMATVFPNAGSAYTYAQQTLHPLLGFLAGWVMLLDYVLIPLMSVIYLALTAQRFFPAVPQAVWLIVFSLSITVMNLFGLRVANRVNFAMTAIMMGVVVWFVAMAVRALQGGAGAGVLLSTRPFYDPATFSMARVFSATSVAAYSYLGFDGISTLAEDARDPKRDIGRATVLVCLCCGFLFILQAYLGQLAWPDFTTYPNTETAFLDVARSVGGQQLMLFVSVALVVAGVASAVTGQASASRLLYGMGRDRLLPSLFAYIHPKYSTPTYGVLLMGAVTLGCAFLLSFQLAAEAINFGALLGFMCVNLSVISQFYVRDYQRTGWSFVSNLVLPALGFAVCLLIFVNLSRTATVIGCVWITTGFAYIGLRTRGFRSSVPMPSFTD
ncbi:MAG: APC family permease [Acidobacteria bacterium]|nr:APC family permease [Acidobacteriota bacterium]